MTRLVCTVCGRTFHETDEPIASVLMKPSVNPNPPEWLNEAFRHWRDTDHDIVLVGEADVLGELSISIIQNACETLNVTREELRIRLTE